MKLKENITKSDVRNTVKDELKTKEFEKLIKKIVADSLEEFHKIMWTRRSFWKDSIKG